MLLCPLTKPLRCPADARRHEQGAEILQEPGGPGVQRECETQNEGVHKEIHAEIRGHLQTQRGHGFGVTASTPRRRHCPQLGVLCCGAPFSAQPPRRCVLYFNLYVNILRVFFSVGSFVGSFSFLLLAQHVLLSREHFVRIVWGVFFPFILFSCFCSARFQSVLM